MDTYRNSPTFAPENIAEWRDWLQNHHDTETSLWLITYKKNSGYPYIPMGDLVDVAICFGWVDSSVNRRDEVSTYRYFTPRRAKSNWSRSSKNKVARLIEEDRMAPAGYKMVELAKANGTWDAMNDVDNLVIPPDLEAEFAKYDNAKENWEGFSRSVRRGMLSWIYNAKRPPTRKKRIEETAAKAQENLPAYN